MNELRCSIAVKVFNEKEAREKRIWKVNEIFGVKKALNIKHRIEK